LKIEAFPPDAQWARDFMVSIERGDVDQMSFSFQTREEEWTAIDGKPLRDLVDVELYDVSPATFPAYTQTSVYLRSIFGMEVREVEGALSRLESGAMMDRRDRSLLLGLIEQIENRLTAAPSEGGGAADLDLREDQLRAHLDHLRVELAKRKI